MRDCVTVDYSHFSNQFRDHSGNKDRVGGLRIPFVLQKGFRLHKCGLIYNICHFHGSGKREVSAELENTTILIVEDNVSNFLLIARQLGHMGLHCEWKTFGYEFVEYADTFQCKDLILMDFLLPNEDGYQALQNHERLMRIPLVAVTAYVSDDQMRRAEEEGFDGFLGKSLYPDCFPGQIRRMLNGDAVREIE